MAKMLAYLMWDKDNAAQHNEKKRGKHWVPDQHCHSEEAIEKHLLKYLCTQFPRQGKRFNNNAGFDNENRIQIAYWDVSEYAKQCNVFVNKGAQTDVDNLLFEDIGYPGDTGTEFIVGDFDELCCEVEDKLTKAGQPKPKVGLSTAQYEEAKGTLEMIFHGLRTLLCEWCARLGKTILGGVLTISTGIPLTVVATYTLMSFASFKKELSKWEQFRDLVIVDARSSTYQRDVKIALDEGKQVVVFLSMCRGGLRQNRIDFLFGLDVQRLILVDEADYGIHRPKQADLLIAARNPTDVVILMTGTNSDRAVHRWEADGFRSVTYPELIINKRAAEEALV